MTPQFPLAALLALTGLGAMAGDLPLPPRPGDAPKGGAFAARIAEMPLAVREREIRAEVTRGNVPDFWRRFAGVKVTRMAGGRERTVAYAVSPDYLAVGADDDFFLAPLSPATAQDIADALGCTLPTRRMVDDIYAAAAVKLAPAPLPPDAAMTTAPVFARHSEIVRQQRAETLAAHPPGALVAGHKKDVVITPQLATATGKVAIYGWHRPDGRAIQPLHLGHTSSWVDYSHGVRLVRRDLTVDGAATTVAAVLADAALAELLSDEGPIPEPRYGEQPRWLHLDPGVRVLLDPPAAFDKSKPVRLVLYALPNGNTIEQTVGRKWKPGDDWHFDIQHIGAQTRWLRERIHGAQLVVAYLECAEKSWPAWRRKHDPQNQRIPEIVDALRQCFAGQPVRLVLTGHSGGGAFTFGLLDGLGRVPGDIERVAFLDSNFAYDTARGHGEQLAQWLTADAQRHLCVLAYDDSVALLNGKPFVSESGGAWGRSRAMREDLAARFEFTSEADAEFQRHTALGGRVKFLLKENPARAVLHTRQVELNGFIHAMLAGTEHESAGYLYFGPRAYEAWIAE